MNDDRPCTCPPMERPHPCARKFALSECKAATVMDPICYRWRHQKDEVWKYGHQPQHLVPPRGKELIGYYIIQSLYTAAALDAAREEARREAYEEFEARTRAMRQQLENMMKIVYESALAKPSVVLVEKDLDENSRGEPRQS